MSIGIFKYFFTYIFKSKTRQKLIFLSISGLLLSSFSLIVLQGVMGGLQNGLVTRSKIVNGNGYIDVSKLSKKELESTIAKLKKNKVEFTKELELELMARHGNYLSAVIIHGIDFDHFVPKFLKHKDKTSLILGGDLARSLRTFFGSEITLISPAHTQILLKEVPRQVKVITTDFYSSELPEIDGVNAWIDIAYLHNLIRSFEVNKLRVYSSFDSKLIKDTKAKYYSWEKENSTLVFALGLETKVMLILFMGTSLLIGICISSGYMNFYNKVKVDLASFWILGLSKKRALNLVYIFSQLVSILFSALGVALGAILLYMLKTNQFVLLPDHFVERNIPVNLELMHVLVAFFVPYLISSIFIYLTFKVFRRENESFINLIKKVG